MLQTFVRSVTDTQQVTVVINKNLLEKCYVQDVAEPI